MGTDLHSCMELSLKQDQDEKYTRYSDQMKQLNEHVSSSMVTLDKNFSAPLAKLLPIFQAVKDRIKKRSHKVIDYDRHKASVKKLKDDHIKSPDQDRKIQAVIYCMS